MFLEFPYAGSRCFLVSCSTSFVFGNLGISSSSNAVESTVLQFRDVFMSVIIPAGDGFQNTDSYNGELSDLLKSIHFFHYFRQITEMPEVNHSLENDGRRDSEKRESSRRIIHSREISSIPTF